MDDEKGYVYELMDQGGPMDELLIEQLVQFAAWRPTFESKQLHC